VAAEDRLLDAQVIEEANHVAGEMLDVVVRDRGGPPGEAVAALVRRDHPAAGIGQGLDLVAPRERQFREAVAQDDRHALARTRLIVGQLDPVDLGPLHRRHHGFKRRHLVSSPRLIV
jgi:hypothetical protein